MVTVTMSVRVNRPLQAVIETIPTRIIPTIPTRIIPTIPTRLICNAKYIFFSRVKLNHDDFNDIFSHWTVSSKICLLVGIVGPTNSSSLR